MDSEGWLPIHVAVDLATRTRYEVCYAVARRLADLDPDSLVVCNPDGDLPLHLAIVRNDEFLSNPLVGYLFERRPEAARVARRDRSWAIHLALERRMFDEVRRMVRHSRDTLQSVDAAGRTPLHVAVVLPKCFEQDGRVPAMVVLRVESCPGSLLIHDANKDLPLHVAIARSSNEANRCSWESNWTVELVTMLLDQCPDSIRTKGAGGKLPLHLAVVKDPPSLPLVQLLVQRCPEAVEEKDADGNLTLHVAVSKDPPSLPLVRLLVEGRPELLGTADAKGNVAFVLAAEKARVLAADTTTQKSSLDLIYWLVRTKPESVASHRAEVRSFEQF